MANVIEIRNLNKRYKDFWLKNISLSVPAGSVMGLIGENGAGKSTLIESILNMTECEYEEMMVFGKDIREYEKEIKEDIAVIFDNTHYNLNFSSVFIGKMLEKVYQRWDMNLYYEYLEQFGIPKKKKLKEFSRGMKMKLEFAIAFSHDAKLLILDEATSGLDPVFRDEMLEILRAYTEEENHTILISSHITSDLDKIADYIAYIHDGELLFVKNYDEVHENYGILNCNREMLEALDPDDVIAYRKETYSYKVMVKNRFEIQKNIKDLEIERASIEDVMLYYAKGEK